MLYTVKTVQEPWKNTFYYDCQFTGEMNCSQRWFTSHDILSRYTKHLSSSPWSGYKITMVLYGLQLILSSYDLIMHLYVHLHFSDCEWHQAQPMCTSFDKFQLSIIGSCVLWYWVIKQTTIYIYSNLYLTVSIFFNILKLYYSSSFSKLLQISKTKNSHVSEPTQFKPMLFKEQL